MAAWAASPGWMTSGALPPDWPIGFSFLNQPVSEPTGQFHELTPGVHPWRTVFGTFPPIPQNNFLFPMANKKLLEKLLHHVWGVGGKKFDKNEFTTRVVNVR